MSKILYYLSDLASKEQIEWLNNLIAKISNCGNDEIIIEHNITEPVDIEELLHIIASLHVTDLDKRLHICNIVGADKRRIEGRSFEYDPHAKYEICADCDVAERMSKMIWLVTNGMMSYSNYTYEAMAEVYTEQIEKLAVKKNDVLISRFKGIKKLIDEYVSRCNENCGSYDCVYCRKEIIDDISNMVSEVLDAY